MLDYMLCMCVIDMYDIVLYKRDTALVFLCWCVGLFAMHVFELKLCDQSIWWLTDYNCLYVIDVYDIVLW